MKNNYTILATVNLTDKNSVRTMWDTLKSIKKDYYESNERIIIIYSSKNNPLLIKSVTEILSSLDIPDFFVLYEINDLPVDDSYSFYLNNNFCFFPWTNLRFDPDGSVRPCCRYQKSLYNNLKIKHNINHDSAQEIYLGTESSALRQTFRDNKWTPNCDACKIDEQAGLLSLRNQTKVKYFDIFHTIDYQTDSITNLQILDLNLGNECNLSCRICSPMYSSKIAKEQQDMNNIKSVTLITASDEYFDNLLKISKNIRYLNIQGGEPLMSKRHFKFLEELIALDYSKNIKIDCSTNGTLYSDKFLKIWDQFEKVKLTFSVDDLGQRFEYQRYGANWNEVETNIKKYCQHKSHKLELGVHPAISIQNVYYLPELIEWIDNMQLPYSFNVIRYPDYLSITQLDSSIKEKICQKLYKFNNNKEIQAIINTLTESHSQTNKEFFSYMKKLDQYRNQKFADSHSDIAKIIGLD